MGLHRIVIEGFTYEEAAAAAAERARTTAMDDVSVTKVDVIVHPGAPDEKAVKIYRAMDYE